MIAQVKYPVVVATVFLWIGFVCAISFMEAWLKFRAPGITLPLGLGIGRLVFNALNKVEWVFALAIIISMLVSKAEILSLKNVFYFIPFVLLLVQTIWLLPALDARAGLYLREQPVPPSDLHVYFVGMEAIKVVSLFIFGILLFKK